MPHQRAQINKMLLHRLALARFGTLPLADEILRRECGHEVQASIQENHRFSKSVLINLPNIAKGLIPVRAHRIINRPVEKVVTWFQSPVVQLLLSSNISLILRKFDSIWFLTIMPNRGAISLKNPCISNSAVSVIFVPLSVGSNV